MSFVLTLFLVLFLSNSRELTPIHAQVRVSHQML